MTTRQGALKQSLGHAGELLRWPIEARAGQAWRPAAEAPKQLNSAVRSGRGLAVQDVHHEGDRRLAPSHTKLQQLQATSKAGTFHSARGLGKLTAREMITKKHHALHCSSR